MTASSRDTLSSELLLKHSGALLLDNHGSFTGSDVEVRLRTTPDAARLRGWKNGRNLHAQSLYMMYERPYSQAAGVGLHAGRPPPGARKRHVLEG